MSTSKKQFENLKPALTTVIIFFVIMTLMSIWTAWQLPSDTKLPIHWNANGEPDNYAGKFLGLFMMPIVVLLMTVLLVVVPRIEPRQKNIKMSMKAYNLIIISIALVFAVLHIFLIMNALGRPFSVEKIVPSLIGLLIILIGNYLGKVRSNYMLGIKTPWTLSSDLSWNKTHRLAGKLFILSGILTILSSLLLSGQITSIILISTILGAAVFATVYSYLVWKKDPDKQTTGSR